MTGALRPIGMRKGLFLAPQRVSETPLVPYRVEVLAQRSPPFLLPAHLSPRSGGNALLLDASGLLPLTRRFPRRSALRTLLQSSAGRRLDRAEAEAVLEKVDAALESAADLLLPLSCIDLAPGSVFLRYQADDTPVPRPFDVLLACVPCRLPPGALTGRESLQRWFESSGLVARSAARPRATRGVPGPKKVRPWHVLAAEGLAVAAGIALDASGIAGVMPLLLAVLVAVDAGLLLHPASPMALRGSGADRTQGAGDALPARAGASATSDRTERLSTAGTVTKMGILSEHEPGSFEETEGRRWFVLVDEFTVGRDPDQVDLVPDALGVSRLHARIRRLGDAFTVEDLSTRNGTFLDDRRLDPGEERVLPERCTLRFAAAKYWFRTE
jgi:hypothetical protein